jgi:hypothetical protein
LAWRRRALIAFGVLAATLLWSGPLASDQIDDALSLVAQERYPEARAALEALLEREPEAPRVRVLHGILLAREGNFIDAIAIFEGLRDERPDMFEAYNNLAVLYAGLGRLDVARRALIAAVELKSDAVLYANLGDVYMRLAQRAYARARELSFEDAAATERGGDADAAAVYPVTPGESFVAAATEDGEQEPVAAPQEAEGAGESPPASADRAGAAVADPVGAASADPVGAASADPVGAASADPVGAASADPVGAASADPAVAAAADPVVAASADLAVAASADPVGTAAADPVGRIGRPGGLPHRPTWRLPHRPTRWAPCACAQAPSRTFSRPQRWRSGCRRTAQGCSRYATSNMRRSATIGCTCRRRPAARRPPRRSASCAAGA